MKVCSSCREALPLSGFHRQSASRDGLMPYCRACNSRKSTGVARARNPDRVKANQQAGRASATVRERKRRLRRYGLDEVSYAALLEAQATCCPGCLEPFEVTPYVDHCHTSGAVRGLLCDGCNKTLGFAKDSAARLRRLADYLERPPP